VRGQDRIFSQCECSAQIATTFDGIQSSLRICVTQAMQNIVSAWNA